MLTSRPAFEADPSVLFNASMLSSVLGEPVGENTLLDAYADHLLGTLQPVQHIHTLNGLDGGEIREIVQANQGQTMTELLVRHIGRDRLATALQSGTDRDETSTLTTPDPFFGAMAQDWELAAMQANGLSSRDVQEVTYASCLEDQTRCNPREADALLIYYGGALKIIEPNKRMRKVFTNNLRMFLTPELKKPSLLAVVSRVDG
jgi:hypothetical protein